MESGVESTSGDQSDDSNNNFWKLVIPRERILFVDSPGSEEFDLFLTALEDAKIVAMDAEWKPVRKAGDSPRVSILQLSCRIDSKSRSWATMERVLLSRKIRTDVGESLEVGRLKQQADIQKQREDIQNDHKEFEKERQELQEEIENEKREINVQREKMRKETAEKKRRNKEERMQLDARFSEQHVGGDDDRTTLTKLGDGLKDLFLGRNGEVSELCEDLEAAGDDTLNVKKEVDSAARQNISPKKVNTDNAEENVDNLCDVLAQAEEEILKHEEGQQRLGRTEEKLETLSMDDIALKYSDPSKNDMDENDMRKNVEVEVNEVNGNLASNSASLHSGEDGDHNLHLRHEICSDKLLAVSRKHSGELCRGVRQRIEVEGATPGEIMNKESENCKTAVVHDNHKPEDQKTSKSLLPMDSWNSAISDSKGSEEENDESGRNESDEIELETDVHTDGDLGGEVEAVPKLPKRAHGKAGLKSIIELEGESMEGEEIIFVLDLLALSASDFSLAMKKLLCSPRVLKLGFAFKQDQLHLAASFPGPDAIGCFEKVEPYIDIAKLYKQLLHVNSVNVKHKGKRVGNGGTYSLTGISKAVLGVPLCKDSQCSNWEQRPLSEEQIEYAAADTHCLLALFDALLPDALTTVANSTSAQACTAADSQRSTIEQRSSNLQETRGVGLKLLTDDPQQIRSNTGHIITHRMGNATEMVEAALHPLHLSPPQEHALAHKEDNLVRKYAKFVKGYSERLLVNEGLRSKSRVRRPRARRARNPLKPLDANEGLLNWIGPAPWDVRIGGDGEPKFLCDVMVEGLARQLRCVGVDAASPSTNKSDPRQLVQQAIGEGRILLTKDIKLLQRRLMPDNLAYYVKKSGKWEQLEEVMKSFEISVTESEILSRCVKCNGEFIPEPLTSKEAKAAVHSRQEIPASVLETCERFWQCSVCFHIFWQGFQFNQAREQFLAVCTRSRKEIMDPRPIQPLDIALEFLEDPDTP